MVTAKICIRKHAFATGSPLDLAITDLLHVYGANRGFATVNNICPPNVNVIADLADGYLGIVTFIAIGQLNSIVSPQSKPVDTDELGIEGLVVILSFIPDHQYAIV